MKVQVVIEARLSKVYKVGDGDGALAEKELTSDGARAGREGDDGVH